MNASLEEKLNGLKLIFQRMEQTLIAYSGGVDSTFLLKVAHDVLGTRAAAITAISPSYPAHELDEARQFAADIGAEMIEVPTEELARPAYRANLGDRCYHCKSELFEVAHRFAKDHGVKHICYGAIPDDLGDDRPGMRAADELSIRAPLIEVGLTKADIRILSKALGLPTWNKPATACLSSRFPVGVPVSARALQTVENCETRLRALGFEHFRARYYEDLVRLEFSAEGMAKVMASATLRRHVIDACKHSGFRYVTVDLEGYRPAGLSAQPIQIDEPRHDDGRVPERFDSRRG
ncbi:MAG: ATP-dependent sacrificial sulfur transferase LarE [Myxococcota bacterium]|nr:ATP-dependent sacrificial sulfur transferase LarE [Myxococcota bacterium]